MSYKKFCAKQDELETQDSKKETPNEILSPPTNTKTEKKLQKPKLHLKFSGKDPSGR